MNYFNSLTPEQIFENGWAAYFKDSRKDMNPYLESSAPGIQWARGWDAAKEIDTFAKDKE